MNEFETICLLEPDLPEDRVKIIQDKVKKFFSDKQMELLCEKDWGKKKLAYKIGRHKFGQYIYYNYSGDGLNISELERLLKYDDNIIRYLTVRLEPQNKIQKGSSAKKISELEVGGFVPMEG